MTATVIPQVLKAKYIRFTLPPTVAFVTMTDDTIVHLTDMSIESSPDRNIILDLSGVLGSFAHLGLLPGAIPVMFATSASPSLCPDSPIPVPTTSCAGLAGTPVADSYWRDDYGGTRPYRGTLAVLGGPIYDGSSIPFLDNSGNPLTAQVTGGVLSSTIPSDAAWADVRLAVANVAGSEVNTIRCWLNGNSGSGITSGGPGRGGGIKRTLNNAGTPVSLNFGLGSLLAGGPVHAQVFVGSNNLDTPSVVFTGSTTYSGAIDVRLEIQSSATELRFYVDDVLVYTYAVAYAGLFEYGQLFYLCDVPTEITKGNYGIKEWSIFGKGLPVDC